jgi:sugar phosphate isomerase/epimerase
MTTRRKFLALSAGAVGAFALVPLKLRAARHPLGLQLYTLRKQAESDLPKTLSEIRSVGYDEVELYWDVYSHPAAELERMLADAGLQAPSGHFDYNGLDTKLDYAKALGLRYVVCPMLPQKMWSSADAFSRAAEQFNRWGEQVQKLGMAFGFHNHNYEFRRFGERTGLDILMANSDPKLVKLEMDCYWVTQAGSDPVALFDKYGSRICMLHLKDRKPGFAPSQSMDQKAAHFAEFGTGSIDWKPILAKANALGVEHYFVEQDEIAIDPIESIRISYQNARKLV